MKTLLKVFVFFILCIWVMKSFAEAKPFLIINENFWSLVNNSEAHCLALNIYHESRGDSLAGKFAVADVVLNRVENRRWPSTICEVVYQGKVKPSWKDPERTVPVRNMCQFSWWCDGKDDYPNNTEAWAESQYIAYQILKEERMRGISEGATHYHATYVDPVWNKSMTSIGRIGSHVFFRTE